MKIKQEVVINIRNRIKNNIIEVVNEINEILNNSEYSSVTDFWKENLQDKFASYTFFSSELKKYNYVYSKAERKFVKVALIEDDTDNKNNSDYTNTIYNSLTNENYNYVSKTISVDENIYNQFDVIAKQSYLSKSYLITLMFKNFVEEFQDN